MQIYVYVCLSYVSNEQGGALSCTAEGRVKSYSQSLPLLSSSALYPDNEQKEEVQRVQDEPALRALSILVVLFVASQKPRKVKEKTDDNCGS